MLAVGAYLVIKKVSFGVGAGDADLIFRIWEGIGETHSLYRGIALLLVGSALAVASRRVAAWVVVVPERGCPGCGYAGASRERHACPECGLPGAGGEATIGARDGET